MGAATLDDRVLGKVVAHVTAQLDAVQSNIDNVKALAQGSAERTLQSPAREILQRRVVHQCPNLLLGAQRELHPSTTSLLPIDRPMLSAERAPGRDQPTYFQYVSFLTT